MSNDMVTWLRQQLDHYEELASGASPGPWHLNAEHDEVLAVDDITVAEGFALSGRQLRATTEHIALHDPTGVLADIEAKRDMLDELDRMERDEIGWDSIEDLMRRMMAVGYAHRPGYKEAWRP